MRPDYAVSPGTTLSYTAPMLFSRCLCWLLFLPLASACATALPPHFSDPDRNPPPGCPRHTHLSAVGQSSQGRDAAVASAKKNLLTKLSHTIHVHVESLSQLVGGNGKESAEYREIARVLEQVDFSHAELIETSGSPAGRNGETYAVACMRRDLAVQALQRDLDVEVNQFDTWDKAATQAQGRGDRPAFVAALGHLSSAMAAAAPRLVQIRALAGGPASVEQHLTSRWLVLVKSSAELRAQIRFVLDLQVAERTRPIASEVGEAFRKALAPLGSEVRLGAVCPATAPATYLVSVKVDAECRLGSLGPTCRPILDVLCQECGSGRQIFRSGLERLQASAVDSRDEAHALRKMAQRLDPKQIGQELRAVLKFELPASESR
jgi:hypothetical protein